MTVVHLRPGAPTRAFERGTPLQLELFENEVYVHGIVAYIDVSACNQEQLLGLIARKSVRAVLDIRCSKAFERFRYNHKEICDYLDSHAVNYVDMRPDIDLLRKSSAMFYWQMDRKRTTDSVGDILASGPCIVLFDSNERNCAIERFRAAVGKPAMAVVEGTATVTPVPIASEECRRRTRGELSMPEAAAKPRRARAPSRTDLFAALTPNPLPVDEFAETLGADRPVR